MDPQPDDLPNADRLTRVMARCSPTEVAIALAALFFALAVGLTAAPI